ncbi:flagellar type III secretion system protein FlhB [Sphingomonas japonica]|uniref:Flagellar biosynthetic protein FlhB n=1 Tax=Sphingomonas japonica TaxID=511662 RepID=A0ABX0TZR9_9SPHN|nr:flagellar type III secretion system protein FlhB [Sphingomonas japonica]NIJ23819.1 flagellar biosynthetic protein FlhB [Sphingomonas japonica]
MAEQSGEKTESPTPKRRQKALDEGDVLRSRDFAAALVVLVGCAWMVMLGPALISACKAVMAASFSFGRGDVEDFQPFRPLAEAGWRLAPSLGGLLALSFVAAILSQAGLGALRFNGKLFAPKASRINPGAGLKRMFGPTGWIELGKSLLKAILLGVIGWYMLMAASHQSIGLVSSDLDRAVSELGGTFVGLMIAMSAGMALIAGIDLPIQIVRRINKLKMTKQEVRDEHKESEGSPEAKGAIRQRQREVMKRGFRKALGEAHVVLTNPTHFSVALRYEAGRDQVPVVVAKGRGATALAIRELAGDMALPILEYPQLARAVYYTSREGQEVRDDLYLAIATVLAFVFGLNAEAAQPQVSVPPSARFDEHGNKLQPA